MGYYRTGVAKGRALHELCILGLRSPSPDSPTLTPRDHGASPLVEGFP